MSGRTLRVSIVDAANSAKIIAHVADLINADASCPLKLRAEVICDMEEGHRVMEDTDLRVWSDKANWRLAHDNRDR